MFSCKTITQSSYSEGMHPCAVLFPENTLVLSKWKFLFSWEQIFDVEKNSIKYTIYRWFFVFITTLRASSSVIDGKGLSISLGGGRGT